MFIKIVLCCLSCYSVAYSQDLIVANMSVDVSVVGVSNTEKTRLSGEYVIDESGFLEMPLLVRKIKASGLTGSKLASLISLEYKEAGVYSSAVFTVKTFKNDAQESKHLREIQRLEKIAAEREEEMRNETRVIHVRGYAKKLGVHKFTHGATIDVALSMCEGDSQFGSNKRIVLKRNGKETEYNYNKNPKVLEIALEPGDFIEIPKGRGFWGKD